MKIGSPDYMWFAPEHLKELESLGDFVRYKNNPKNETELIKRIKEADIVVNFWFPMNKKMFDSLPELKMVCVAAAGFDWIDIDAARKNEVLVVNCPGHNTESVAEHTIGLMICAARSSFSAAKSLEKGEFRPTSFKGIDLRGKTLGIIGYGRIGKRVSEIARKGLGMKVISLNSKSSKSECSRLLKESDVIAVTSPLTDKTRNMIGEKEFDMMKDGVVIINTGRGAVINEKAMLKNLKNGKIRAAGLDTYEFEPPKKLVPMTKFKNVIATPHISWDTEETDYYLSQMVVDNVKAFIKGNPVNKVN